MVAQWKPIKVFLICKNSINRHPFLCKVIHIMLAPQFTTREKFRWERWLSREQGILNVKKCLCYELIFANS